MARMARVRRSKECEVSLPSCRSRCTRSRQHPSAHGVVPVGLVRPRPDSGGHRREAPDSRREGRRIGGLGSEGAGGSRVPAAQGEAPLEEGSSAEHPRRDCARAEARRDKGSESQGRGGTRDDPRAPALALGAVSHGCEYTRQWPRVTISTLRLPLRSVRFTGVETIRQNRAKRASRAASATHGRVSCIICSPCASENVGGVAGQRYPPRFNGR